MDDFYKNIQEYNSDAEPKLLIIFDYIITYMISNKKFIPTVTEVIITGLKLNISLIFSPQSCFPLPKSIIINSTHYFVPRK